MVMLKRQTSKTVGGGSVLVIDLRICDHELHLFHGSVRVDMAMHFEANMEKI